MPKTIRIRDVPDDLHRKLAERAASKGLTLSEYILRLVEIEASRPTIEELTERIRSRESAAEGLSAAEIVRELREEMG